MFLRPEALVTERVQQYGEGADSNDKFQFMEDRSCGCGFIMLLLVFCLECWMCSILSIESESVSQLFGSEVTGGC